MIRRRVAGDRISEIIVKRYGIKIPTGFSFRTVLTKSEYRQAVLHLNWAEGGFATNRSFWATQMDNFNQILLTVVYKKLGVSFTRGSEFGAMASKSLITQFPNLAAVFKNCHDIRSSNPVPHSYSTLLGTFSRSLKPKKGTGYKRHSKLPIRNS